MLASAATCVSAQTKTATTTTFAATAGGTAATSIASGTAVTLTAAVSAGPTAITRGQVNFCDASATYCTDIHLLGMAQITSAGTATLKLRPGIGSHSYKAVFLGTNTYAGSASGTSALTVTGKYPTTMVITTLPVGIAGSLVGVYAGHATLGSSASTAPGPTGQLTVTDTTSGNTVLQTEPLGTATVGPNLVTASNTQTGTGPGADVAGDFNGDGNLDLAVDLSSGTPPLSILLGDGTGKFTAAPASSITVTGAPLLVQDFNSDGIPDILFGDGTGGQVTILLGNGDGTFRVAPGSPISMNSGSYSVAAADFNGDGIPDVALSGGNFLVVLLGNGDGTFTQVPINSSSISGSNPAVSMVAGDFDGDGIPDLAVLSEDNVEGGGQLVSVLLGNGDGTFRQGASIIASPIVSGGPLITGPLITMVTGDFNGDGKLDLAVPYPGDRGTATVTILLGNGSGMFEQATGSPISVYLAPNWIGLGDVNGDGIADLLGEDTNIDMPPTFLVGNGDGTFRSIVTSGFGLWDNSGTFVNDFNVGDFNNDGLTDLVSSIPSTNTVQLLVSQLTEATIPLQFNPPGQGPQQIVGTYAGDDNFSGTTSNTLALTPFVATPQINPAPGTYGIGQTIQLTDSSAGATIYYSGSGIVNTNGFVPYAGPITLPTLGKESITYYASGTGYQDSARLTVAYTVSSSTLVPTISVTPSTTNVTNAQADDTVSVAVSGASGQPTPTGSVTLSAGVWSGQQTLSSGSATFTVPTRWLSAGSNTVTVQYSGDATYLSASGTATITVSPVVATGQTPSAISPGGNASSVISFSSGSTYSGTLNLTCALTSSPNGAQSLPTCNMKPTSIPLTSGANGASTLTVTTTAAGTTARLHPLGGPMRWFGGGGATLAMLLLFGIPIRRRRWTSLFVLLLAFSISAFGVIGCGGGNSGGSGMGNTGGNGGGGGVGGGGGGQTIPATTAGNYTFTVTGTDSVNPKITTSTIVVVTVQ